MRSGVSSSNARVRSTDTACGAVVARSVAVTVDAGISLVGEAA